MRKDRIESASFKAAASPAARGRFWARHAQGIADALPRLTGFQRDRGQPSI
jgi:hypothetical protein